MHDVKALLPDAVKQLLMREVDARPAPLVHLAAALKVVPEVLLAAAEDGRGEQ